MDTEQNQQYGCVRCDEIYQTLEDVIMEQISNHDHIDQSTVRSLIYLVDEKLPKEQQRANQPTTYQVSESFRKLMDDKKITIAGVSLSLRDGSQTVKYSIVTPTTKEITASTEQVTKSIEPITTTVYHRGIRTPFKLIQLPNGEGIQPVASTLIYIDHNQYGVEKLPKDENVKNDTYRLFMKDNNYDVVKFQNGVIGEDGPNGWTNEQLLAVIIDRVRRLNEKVPSVMNERAIGNMRIALSMLEFRTMDRQNRNVEGTDQV